MDIYKLFNKLNLPFNNDVNYVLVLSLLHLKGIIKDEKLKGQFQALRKGTLTKVKGTYHSSINNRWYSHDNPIEIFNDYLKIVHSHEMSIEEVLKYFNMYFNKGHNYSVNVFMNNIVSPLLNSWNPKWDDEYFEQYSSIQFPNLNLKCKSYSSECYSCGSTHTEYDTSHYDIRKQLTEYFHSIKKGNLSKIPKTTL